MNPKKVLIFSVVYYPKFVGGAEVAVKEITDRFDPQEYEFHLVALRLHKKLPKQEKIGNVFVYRVGFGGETEDTADSMKFPLHYNKYLYPFLSVWKGLSLSRQHNLSFTWAIMANYSGFGALFFKLLKPKIPFLLTLQEGDPTDYIENKSFRVGTGSMRIPVNFFMRPIFKMIFKKSDQIQAISKYLAIWGKKMGFGGEPVVVPNGVDTAKFEIRNSKYESEDRQEVRKELGLKEGDVALITTSRLVIKNGVGDVIKALPKLENNVKFVICGEGYLKEKLVALVRDLGVSDRVIWKGYVPHSEMPKYLNACDIFIRPALSEGFGNSFIEAMACRLPVIATPVGGIPDFLKDDPSRAEIQTGYFCTPENPGSIVEVVNKVIDNVETKEVIKENAYKMVKEKYDWVLIAKQMKGVFDNMTIKNGE